MNRTASHAEEAKAYLEKHKLEHVMQQLMTVLVHQRPADPKALLVKKLEEIKSARARNQSLSLFTKENLVAVFRIFDVTGRGYISMAQYAAAMEDIGVSKFNATPIGADQDRITLEAFVDNAFAGLLKPLG
ncbi:hypothetical protein DFJ73DRAFT_799088 [Zopfochytrium polystomum]|nr:hypothetical protein DFJ73DRAFT_799088 [Zopfochytrium polystomum]